jgi:hypothetical protein
LKRHVTKFIVAEPVAWNRFAEWVGSFFRCRMKPKVEPKLAGAGLTFAAVSLAQENQVSSKLNARLPDNEEVVEAKLEWIGML